MIICIFNYLSLHGNICQVGQKVCSVKHYRKTQTNFLTNPVEVIWNLSYPKLNPWIALLIWLWQPTQLNYWQLNASLVQAKKNLASSLIFLFLLFSTLNTTVNLVDSFKIYAAFSQFSSPLLNITLVQARFIPEMYYYKSNQLLPFVCMYIC